MKTVTVIAMCSIIAQIHAVATRWRINGNDAVLVRKI